MFLLVTVLSNAQNASISGNIADAMSREALEYASVAVYKTSDSSLVTGIITDESGNFNIEKMDKGSYYIRSRFLGYKANVTRSFSLAAGQHLTLDTIFLEPAKQMVQELTVSGNRIYTTNKLEKQSYDASRFESAKGGSALDVIKNMPSVALNGQGEITVRGSSGFMVLLNGKPVLLDAQTLLAQIPANSLDHVELITSPSAKYDPDGKAGIINITTKKGAANGSGILLNAGYGLPGMTDYGNARVALRHNLDLLYNYRKNKWDISFGGNYQRNDLAGYREGDVFTEDLDRNTITRFPSMGERSFKRYYYATRATLSYTANPANTFSFGIFSGKRYQERDANLNYMNSTSTLDTDLLLSENPYYNANKQIKEGTFTLGNFDYTHTFYKKSSLTASFLYEFDDLYGTTHNSNLTEFGGQVIQYVQNPYQKPIKGYRLRLDYMIPFEKGKLESGYQFRSDVQDGTFDYIITPEILNQPELNRFRGTAKSENSTHSFYSQFSGKSMKLEYLAGLRYEYSMRTVELSFDPKTHQLNLSNFFPSANLLYSLAPGLGLKAGYSRRIQRSTNNQLNPIPEREHSETLEIGDPDLLPEFIGLSEISLIKKLEEMGSVFFTAYNQASKNPVQRVNSIYADTILNRVYTNIERGNALGFETAADLHPASWWDLFLGANIFRQSYSGELIILDAPAIAIDNSGWAWSANVNTSFHITSSFSLQVNLNYLSKRPTAQGEDSRYLVPNLSLKKDFLDKRLSASLQWQNIDLGLEQINRQRITTFGEHFYTTTNYIYETDFLLLQLSYNLNFKSSKTNLPGSEFGEKEF